MSLNLKYIKAQAFFLMLLACFFLSIQAHAQSDIDSLKNVLNLAKTDTAKARTLLNLAKRNLNNSLPESIAYTEECLELSEKSNFSYGLIYGASFMQYLQLRGGKYDESEKYAKMTLKYAEANQDSVMIAAAYSSLGNVAFKQGNKEGAFKQGLKGLEIYELLKDEQGQAKILHNLGNYLWFADQGKEALPYFERSFEIKQRLGDIKGQSSTLNSLGNLYDEVGESEKALEATKKAIEINKQIKNAFGLSINYTTAGIIYDGQKEYLLAQEYHEKALQISREIGDIEGEIINSENLGSNLTKQGKYRQGIIYLKEALRITEKEDYTETKVSILKSLSDTYYQMGNFRDAYETSTQFTQLQDSLNQAENKETLAEMKTKFETEKKNEQIQLLTESNELKEGNIQKQQFLNYSLLAILGLGLILAFVLWKQYQLKLKTSQLLTAKNEELKTLNATKDKLFAIVSHDLKNPLSAFKTITQSLSENLQEISKEEIDYFLKELESSASQLYDLLQNLLSWSVSQINQLPYQPQKLDLAQLISGNIAQLSSHAKTKNISIQQHITDNQSVSTDKPILQTILRNFISNAIKFTPEGGEIQVSAQSGEKETHIYVKDNGVGISSTDLVKLFRIEADPSQVGNSPEKGTGLGLILCKELAEKLGGSVGAESEEGKGSAFYVTIPN